MEKSRLHFSSQDASPSLTKSKDWDALSRWSEYLKPDVSSTPTSKGWKHVSFEQSLTSGSFQKAVHIEWVIQLSQVAEGLMAKMYRLIQILDHPDLVSYTFTESFWKAGVFPNCPRICLLVSKKFPDHPNKLQLERVEFLA
ncbi:Protein NAP1 [Acorus calamus]|uniref:Protein NAP1 n=1 Tax=Acorus calamus TaxID=4465 RepID=A0AAV9DRW3_ACOCL|nr:Protein NAP1 [Acorus calamus]